jgi:hypothetical protein
VSRLQTFAFMKAGNKGVAAEYPDHRAPLDAVERGYHRAFLRR